MKFRAKVDTSKLTMDEEWQEFFEEKVTDGYIAGFYADGYILGDLVESNDEYIIFEYWIPVHKDTVERVEVTE